MITEPSFQQGGNPVATRFIRKAISYKNQLLVVSDHLGQVTLDNCVIDASAGRQPIVNGVKAYDWSQHLPDSPIRCVVHIDTQNVTRAAFERALFSPPAPDPTPNVILLQVSSVDGGLAEDSMIRSNFIWLSMKYRTAYTMVSHWLPEFLTLDFKTAKELAGFTDRNQAAKHEDKFGHFLDIILPGDPTALLAFRLLCEARLACGNQDDLDMSGLKIKAPRDLGAWLAPFSTHGDEDQRIAAVVALMGSASAKKAAKAVFDALERNENALEEAKVFPGVSELIPSSTPSQEGGAA
jgi:hypothetical protein